MDNFTPILGLIGFLVLGFVLGRKRWIPGRLVDRLLSLTMYALLFLMGFSTGRLEGILKQLGQLGLTALGATGFALAGSLTAVALTGLTGVFRVRAAGGAQPAEVPDRTSEKASPGAPAPAHSGAAAGAAPPSGSPSPFGASPARLSAWRRFLNAAATPALLLSFVGLGFGAGAGTTLLSGLDLSWLPSLLVQILVLLVGLQTGAADPDLKAWLRQPALIALPLATALGSLAGGALFGLAVQPWLPSLRLSEAMAITGGFGWYSLSGVLLTERGAPLLGSLSFLSNLMRESLAFGLIPLLAALGWRHGAVSVGGATTMDVTLPLIEQRAGVVAVPLALAHGLILSLLVPLVVPLIHGAGF